MVELRNLKKKNNIIECDILPEDSIAFGHVQVDLNSGKTIDYFLPKGYEYCTTHVAMAKDNLIKLASKNTLPKKYLVMWY